MDNTDHRTHRHATAGWHASVIKGALARLVLVSSFYEGLCRCPLRRPRPSSSLHFLTPPIGAAVPRPVGVGSSLPCIMWSVVLLLKVRCVMYLIKSHELGVCQRTKSPLSWCFLLARLPEAVPSTLHNPHTASPFYAQLVCSSYYAGASAGASAGAN